MSKLGTKIGQIDIHKRKSFLEQVGDFIGGVFIVVMVIGAIAVFAG